MDLYFSPYATSSNQTGNKVSSNCLHRTPEDLKGVWGFTLTDHDISIVYNYPKYALERANAPCEQKIFGHIAPPPPQFCKVIHIHNQRPFFRQDFLYKSSRPHFQFASDGTDGALHMKKKIIFKIHRMRNITSVTSHRSMKVIR